MRSTDYAHHMYQDGQLSLVEGDRGEQEKRGRRCTRGGRRVGGKRDSQGGGKQEKKGKIMLCIIL